MNLKSDSVSSIRPKLGEILMRKGRINIEQLEEALNIQKKDGKLLGEILVNRGYLEEADIVVALIMQCGLPYIAIKKYEFDKKILQMIPEDLVREFHALPLDCQGKTLSVAMADPLNETTKTVLAQITGMTIAPFIATRSELEEVISKIYGPGHG